MMKRPQIQRRAKGERVQSNNNTGLVNITQLLDDSPLIMKVEPQVEGVNLPMWLRMNGALITELVHKHGVLLFRGFGMNTEEDGITLNASLPWNKEEPNSWENTAPRHKVSENVFVASTVPKTESIFLHSDHTQSVYFAEKITFYCGKAPESGGENPFADNREILKKLDPEVRETFKQKGWKLIRNFHDSLGVSFSDAFWDRSVEDVENYCAAEDISIKWYDGVARTSQTRAAVVQHPVTGEDTWYNHVGFWHLATLPDDIREQLMEQVGLDGMPFNTLYGDGTPIPDEVALHIREVMDSEQKTFAWQQGDFLVADNVLTCHGRAPYIGERKTRLGLFNRSRRPDFAV